MLLAADFRQIDGSDNNLSHSDWGQADTQLMRMMSVDYGDGMSLMAGYDRPSARSVSNAVAAQSGSLSNDRYLTDFVWQWGQFLDHDLDLTPEATPAESAPILVAAGDPHFDPFATGTVNIGMSRSIYDTSTGTDAANPRQQMNEVTAYIDASNVYGSDEIRAWELRTGVGGKLKTSDGDLLPFNTAGLPNAGGESPTLFLAGDVRANEQVGLTTMHTLFVREHNRLADELAAENPSWSDEQIYQHARQIVGAQMQAITFNEFLPALLGTEAFGAYSGYRDDINPGIANAFSTAAYRFGHSMLSPELLRLDASGNEIEAGHLSLRDAFFNPTHVINEGIDAVLRGLAAQTMQEVDQKVVDDVRNFLFGPPGAGGFDLISLNLQRGRDHGLPSYNQARQELGLAPITSFSQLSSNAETAAAFASVYQSVNDIDLWIGGLAEDHLPGSSVGELFTTILVHQFESLREGDRYWYENIFAGDQLTEIRNTRLSDIIRRNSEATGVQDNVFFAPSVLTHQIPADSAQQVGVRQVAGQVQIYDLGSGSIFSQQAASQTDMIRIAGSVAPGDQASEIDVQLTGLASLPGGIQLFGNSSGRDRLQITGTESRDRFDVYAEKISVDSHTIEFSEFAMLSIDARGGSDRVRVKKTPDAALAFYGGEGSDELVGGHNDDLLVGGSGRDRIFGNAGNDVLIGGDGDDEIEGGSGDDWIFGNRGRDSLSGNLGNDMIFGGRGADILRGNRGSDILDGQQGNDTMKPGVDDDLVIAAQGHDKMVGMNSHDMMLTNSGNNLLRDMRIRFYLQNANIANDAALMALIEELSLLDIV